MFPFIFYNQHEFKHVLYQNSCFQFYLYNSTSERCERHVFSLVKKLIICLPHLFITTAMSTQKTTKRKRGKGPMIIGDVDSARVVTPKTIYETKKDGSVVAKEVWGSLYSPAPDLPAIPDNSKKKTTMEYEAYDIPSPQLEDSESVSYHPPTQRNYMQQYVDRVDEFLDALLSREAGGASTCRHCNKSIAVWRCRDCVLGTPMCRSCMRLNHRENPFHRIERWNGSYYRPAELREVGTYLLIRHYTGVSLCETLTGWINLLDSAEKTNDSNEQDMLRRLASSSVPRPESAPVPAPDIYDIGDPDFDMDGDIDLAKKLLEDEGEDLGDGDEELDELDDDNPYVENAGTGTGVDFNEGAGTGVDPAVAAATFDTLTRVVHTNGIHHIPMVRCTCHGDDVLPLDLFASQLLPSSLKRIKTLFTAQLLDLFRLCNLELKASAYQFYQLLRRLTRPMAPAEVLDLYREFRRMSRIWRWMKKLKWAGYAGSSKKVKDVEAGELAIFCPACPQQGINIPDNWREDKARHVYIFSPSYLS